MGRARQSRAPLERSHSGERATGRGGWGRGGVGFVGGGIRTFCVLGLGKRALCREIVQQPRRSQIAGDHRGKRVSEGDGFENARGGGCVWVGGGWLLNHLHSQPKTFSICFSKLKKMFCL